MIIGHINNTEEEQFYPLVLRNALEHLRSTDFSTWELGKYPIEGDDLFLLVQEATTEPLVDRRPESHVRYLDIQYLLSGQEIIGTSFLTGKETVTEDALEERDIAFYADVIDENQIIMQPGMYGIFFPTDIHRPVCQVGQPQKIRKVVVKIRKSLLG